jgi:putative hemolysin
MMMFVLLVLLLLSSFFSGIEAAFFSLHSSQVRLIQAQRKKRGKIIAYLKAHPQRLLITILIGNNIVNLLAASLATVVSAKFFGSAAVGVATGLTTFFILIFGEILPKSIALTHTKEVVLLAARPVLFLYYLFYPLSSLLIRLNKLLNKRIGNKRSGGVTEEEIRIMTRMGVENGAIDYWEREMIENIFRFDDIPVGDIITPLYRVDMLNGMVPVDQIAHFVSQSGHSRFPVQDKSDDIVGYVHVNTLMRALNSDERDKLVIDFMSSVEIIDENMRIERVFRAMKRNKAHLYLVHRENKPKDIIGLVTLEDILEEIVGEIEDETDDVDYT